MQAVEFEADTDNGVIVIPEAYRHTLQSKHLRVIVLGYEARHEQHAMPQGFQNPVQVPSYKQIAKREEIYGR
jgi:hypothetical protein